MYGTRIRISGGYILDTRKQAGFPAGKGAGDEGDRHSGQLLGLSHFLQDENDKGAGHEALSERCA